MGANQMGAELEVPGVGARGGLGRTLLTAFLVLAIFPLSVVSWYATDRSRSNIQAEVIEKLSSIAEFKEVQISRWTDEWVAALSLPEFGSQVAEIFRAGEPDEGQVRAFLAETAYQWGVTDLALLDSEGHVQWAGEPSWEGDTLVLQQGGGSTVQGLRTRASLAPHYQAGIVLIAPLAQDVDLSYVAVCIPLEMLTQVLHETVGLGQTGMVYLVDRDGMALPQGRRLAAPAIETALQGLEGQNLYENYDGVPVIGVSRWLPTLDLVLFVEQSQEEAFAGNNAVATAVVAATLIVAMVTAVFAAFVTRQITRPVVHLTESALRIATGDLSQEVEVASRDEIGILANVFNRMSADLEVLYQDLEEKVAQRTELLQKANYLIQRRAIQMQASLEVGRVITSILNPDRLLEQVVGLVKNRFVYSYVVVYTVDGVEEDLTLRASAGEPDPFYGYRIPTDAPGSVGRAYRRGAAVVEKRTVPLEVGPATSYTRTEVVLPLRLGDRTLGVLGVQSTEEDVFDQDEISVLQNVVNQVTVALENARAYAVERDAVERLREANRSTRRFLANMSRELRTPLTNIIGFSQLMLREIDGPLEEEQASDLQIIYENGQHLLGLIGDLLDVSQIEAGLMELEFRQVDLIDLIESVMATGSALVRGKPVTLLREVPADLPVVQADPVRIRQVLLRLLTNAARFTEIGEIRVRAWADGAHVKVSVSDTGIGIPLEDRERIFGRFEQGTLENGRRPNGAGLGLALSKEFVEMHGGEIKVESTVGIGSTFTFSLPMEPE